MAQGALVIIVLAVVAILVVAVVPRLGHRGQRPSQLDDADTEPGGAFGFARTRPGAPLLADGAGGSHPGEQVGRYRIEREIARGATGAVYAARDPNDGQAVALKTILLASPAGGTVPPDDRERLQRELQAAARLQHPDIVRVFDAGDNGQQAWMAMELVGGRDLSAYAVAGHLLPVAVVLNIGARVARALAYAHRQGVVHRDIKPANVIIDLATGRVKVADFGIAHLPDAARTRTGLVLGTPSFMAPEQMAGRRVDGRADLYSLGAMLFQLLTGQLPFEAPSVARLMAAIANDPAPDVLTIRSDLPPELAQAVTLALEKRPELRYADGDQMAADLEAIAAMLDSDDRAELTQQAQTTGPNGADPRQNAQR